MRQNHPTAGFIPRAPPPAPLEAPVLQKKDTYGSKFLLRSVGSAQIDFSPTATGRISSLLDSDPGVSDEGVDKENPLSLLIRAVWCRQGHVETLLQHVALSVAGSELQEPCALVCIGAWSPDNGLDQWGLCANLAGPKLGDNSALRCRSYGLSRACPVGSWSHRVTRTTEPQGT